jgi:lipopolysaccharide export system permease protein
MAQNAEFRDAGDEGISLDLHDAFIQSSKEIVREDYDYASASFLRYWVPQEDIIQAVSYITPNNMSSVDVRKEIVIRTQELRERLEDRRGRAVGSALNLENILRQGPAGNEWNRRDNYFIAYSRDNNAIISMQDDRTIQNYWLEYYKKFSIPFGAFFFVFLAVPLGFMAKRSGQTVGFIFGMVISLLYWTLLIGGQTLGFRLGYSPFWSMWLPNILTGSIGLIMCIQRIRK